MPRKIVLIASLVTLAFWLGSLAGCASQSRQENNYKILKDDQPAVEHTRPDKPGASSRPAATQPMMASALPSLNGVDRSRWERITLTPANGETRHTPVYFHDCPIGVPANDPSASQLDHTLAQNPLAEDWDAADAAAFVGLPGKFMFDMVTHWGEMFFLPPWTKVQSP